MYTTILRACLKCGISLSRWCRVDSVMLEKMPFTPYLHKLRVIHIYEANYNLTLRLIAWHLSWYAEDNNQLSDAQWGSRSGKSCVDLTLLQNLTYEIAWKLRSHIASLNLDMKACHDRMLPPLTSLIQRSLGTPVSLMRLHGQMQEQMHYHIHASLGSLTDYYQHTLQSPSLWNGQGAGDSPTSWGITSDKIAKIK